MSYRCRRQIDPVAEMSLTQSVPCEPFPLLNLFRFGGGSVLRKRLGQFGVGVNKGFDQYANVRPARVLPGVKSPLHSGDQIDWVVVRENSEGEYSGNSGRVHRGLPRRCIKC